MSDELIRDYPSARKKKRQMTRPITSNQIFELAAKTKFDTKNSSMRLASQLNRDKRVQKEQEMAKIMQDMIYRPLKQGGFFIGKMTTPASKSLKTQFQGFSITSKDAIHTGIYSNLSPAKYTGVGYQHRTKSNTVYIGEFDNSFYTGFGQFQSSRFRYIGEMKNSLKNGFGFYEDLKQKISICGFFQADRFNGWTEIYEIDGKLKYRGEFKNGQKNGFGHQDTTRHSYLGQFVAGKQQGFGLLTKLGDLHHNSFYLGKFENGRYSDYCLDYKWFKEDQVYEGELLHGKRHGIGRLNKGVLGIYTGGFRKGKKQGIGLFQDPEEVFLGSWKEDKRHGMGCQQMGKYEFFGMFETGQKSGYGIEEVEGEYRIKGFWRHGELQGKFLYKDFRGMRKFVLARYDQYGEVVKLDSSRFDVQGYEVKFKILKKNDFMETAMKRVDRCAKLIKQRRRESAQFYEQMKVRFRAEDSALKKMVTQILLKVHELKIEVIEKHKDTLRSLYRCARFNLQHNLKGNSQLLSILEIDQILLKINIKLMNHHQAVSHYKILTGYLGKRSQILKPEFLDLRMILSSDFDQRDDLDIDTKSLYIGITNQQNLSPDGSKNTKDGKILYFNDLKYYNVREDLESQINRQELCRLNEKVEAKSELIAQKRKNLENYKELVEDHIERIKELSEYANIRQRLQPLEDEVKKGEADLKKAKKDLRKQRLAHHGKEVEFNKKRMRLGPDKTSLEGREEALKLKITEIRERYPDREEVEKEEIPEFERRVREFYSKKSEKTGRLKTMRMRIEEKVVELEDLEAKKKKVAKIEKDPKVRLARAKAMDCREEADAAKKETERSAAELEETKKQLREAEKGWGEFRKLKKRRVDEIKRRLTRWKKEADKRLKTLEARNKKLEKSQKESKLRDLELQKREFLLQKKIRLFDLDQLLAQNLASNLSWKSKRLKTLKDLLLESKKIMKEKMEINIKLAEKERLKKEHSELIKKLKQEIEEIKTQNEQKEKDNKQLEEDLNTYRTRIEKKVRERDSDSVLVRNMKECFKILKSRQSKVAKKHAIKAISKEQIEVTTQKVKNGIEEVNHISEVVEQKLKRKRMERRLEAIQIKINEASDEVMKRRRVKKRMKKLRSNRKIFALLGMHRKRKKEAKELEEKKRLAEEEAAEKARLEAERKAQELLEAEKSDYDEEKLAPQIDKEQEEIDFDNEIQAFLASKRPSLLKKALEDIVEREKLDLKASELEALAEDAACLKKHRKNLRKLLEAKREEKRLKMIEEKRKKRKENPKKGDEIRDFTAVVFKSPASKVNETMLEHISVVSLSEDGSVIHAGGENWVSIYKIIESSFDEINILDNYKQVRNVRQLPSGHIVLHLERSNCLIFLREGNHIQFQRINGEDDPMFEGKIKDARFRRHDYLGRNGEYMWSSGAFAVSFCNLETFEVRKIPDFWILQGDESTPEKPLLGIFCTSEPEMKRIFGVGLDPPTKTDYLIFYESPQKRAAIPLTELSESIKKVNCAVSNKSGKFVFLGGSLNKKACVGAITFDELFKPLKFQIMSKVLKRITCMNRVIGTDILICGGARSILIVRLDKISGEFEVLNQFLSIADKGNFGWVDCFDQYVFGFIPDTQMIVKMNLKNEIPIEGLRKLVAEEDEDKRKKVEEKEKKKAKKEKKKGKKGKKGKKKKKKKGDEDDDDD